MGLLCLSLKTKNAELKDQAEAQTRVAVAIQKEHDAYKAWAVPLLAAEAAKVEELTIQLANQSGATVDAEEDILGLELLEPVAPDLEQEPLVINLRGQIEAHKRAEEGYRLQLNTMYDMVGSLTTSLNINKDGWMKAEDAAREWKDSSYKWEASSNDFERRAKLARLMVWRTLGGSAVIVACVVVILLLVR